jgi:hypothetical protein
MSVYHVYSRRQFFSGKFCTYKTYLEVEISGLWYPKREEVQDQLPIYQLTYGPEYKSSSKRITSVFELTVLPDWLRDRFSF